MRLQLQEAVVRLFCTCILQKPELQCVAVGSLRHLYKQQISTGVFGVTQCCCQPVLHISIEQWAVHFAKSCLAVQWCRDTVHLYEQLVFMSIVAEAQSHCQSVLQAAMGSEQCIFPKAVLLWMAVVDRCAQCILP